MLEVVVSAGILVLVMAGSYWMVINSMNLIQTARDSYAAASLGNARLERARNMSYEEVWQLAEANTLVDDYGLPTSMGRFRRTTAVTNNVPSSGCSLVCVVTEVRKPRSSKVEYYLTQSMSSIVTSFDSLDVLH